MARIGPLLKDARASRALSLDRVAEDTNIGIRYLSGLEQDDFSMFPGEPYIVGFMRNYAEYLGLDGDTVIARYRSREPVITAPPVIAAGALPSAAEAPPIAAEAPPVADMPPDSPPAPAPAPAPAPRKGRRRSMDPKDPLDAILAAAPPDIQHNLADPLPRTEAPASPAIDPAAQSGQAPTPPEAPSAAVDAPAAPPRSLPRWAVPAAAAAGIALIVVLAMLVRGGFGRPSAAGAGIRTPVEYRVEGMPFEKRLYLEDSLVFVIGQDLYKARLTAIDEAVAFETPFGPVKIHLGKDSAFDADGDGVPEVALVVADFAKRNPSAGALVRLESRAAEVSADTAAGADIKVPQDATTVANAQAKGPAVLFTSARGPYPFVATVTFRGPCMFRYESDRRDWVEKYYSKGETITINANNALVMWASNARAARVSVQASGNKTADLELGGAGEIAVKRLAWSQATGSWALTATDVD